jgi:hypothetical protein
MQQKKLFNHGWTQMHTDKKGNSALQMHSPIREAFWARVSDFLSGFNPCLSVSIRGLIE